MIKVILADDEPMIVKGLKKMISWESLGVKVVGEAFNGIELLNKIEELRPNLVISDIEMPRKTGLDVIEEIQKRNLNLKVIFLSGYREFNYVKTAMKNDAVDYLVKPVSKRELEEAIIKANKMLNIIKNDKNIIEKRSNRKTEYYNISLEDECTNIIEHLKNINIDMKAKKFLGISFMISNKQTKKIMSQSELEIVCFSIFEKVIEYLNENKNGVVVKKEANAISLIITIDSNKNCELEKFIDDIEKLIIKEYKIKIIIGIGEAVESSNNLKHTYKTSRYACNMYYFNEARLINFNEINRPERYSLDDYSMVYKEMIQAILSGKENWEIKLNNILDILESLQYGNKYSLENSCITLAMDLYRDMREYNVLSDNEKESYDLFVLKIRNKTTYRELKVYIKEHIKKVLEKSILNKGFLEKDVIYQAKLYVQEHYRENISLAKMAEMFYMNLYYFSVFFKKETGKNFKNYLIEIRMKEALKLLMESDIKTYELAKSVGYNDVGTFTQKFREYYGDTPSEYKKSKR